MPTAQENFDNVMLGLGPMTSASRQALRAAVFALTRSEIWSVWVHAITQKERAFRECNVVLHAGVFCAVDTITVPIKLEN